MGMQHSSLNIQRSVNKLLAVCIGCMVNKSIHCEIFSIVIKNLKQYNNCYNAVSKKI